MTSKELETILVGKIDTMKKVAEEIARRYNAISETDLKGITEEDFRKLVSQDTQYLKDFSESMGCIYAYQDILNLIKEVGNEQGSETSD